jgi:hypothetical protein
LAGLLQGPGRQALNWYLDNHTTSSILSTTAEEEDSYFNFTEPLVRMNRFLSSKVNFMNGYVNCVANVLSRLVEQRFPQSLQDSPFLELRSFDLLDAGSLRNVSFLNPKEGTDETLQSALEYGSTTMGQGRPRVAAVVDLAFAPLNLTAQLNLEMSLDDLNITGGSALRYDSTQLR